ncbi:galactonate dehydratase [Haloferax volcanii]|uniref:Galactonate dehydratase n=3 Tax=Haloferax volcanii TaxID=2246 RepID=A0A384K9P1_HALVD|nr:galactonate dehydratase [Haloferax volcanii]ADE02196.1 D-galactonate dehydratase [Haloferax volcanii DS2]ELY31587.1 galactonate dehydratase [Haloferax volcanii DS2]MBS8121088.1 galactonate dehydratase [Haloferax volcanii]MBS8126099.1 galactonate dehydratase [Haloferax volcanii]MBS8129953.1 galactonate dehydratase [Haloferax volcanii]
MEITGYELFEVPPRWVFLKLETDAGVCGWGEPIVEGYAKTTKAAVEEMVDNYLLGTDPLEIERHWQAMYRGRHFRGGPVLMSAIGGIDQALWDIKGKHYGAPVYDLLGGKARDRIRVYQWVGGETPEAIARAAAEEVDRGYDCLKLSAVSQLDRIDSPAAVARVRERLEAVRSEVGDDVDIVVDFRGRITTGMAKWVADELDPLDPMFYEEPVLPEHARSLPRIENRTKVPLATGERLYSRWDFERTLELDAIDVLQPSPSHAGGISEVRKIATAAEAKDMLVSLHCPLGPISFASCLHLDMVLPNAIAQAQNLEIHRADGNDLLGYLDDPAVFGFDDGFVSAPDAPGLGVKIDEEAVREHAQSRVDWQSPIWYHEDGSVAEW